MFIELKLHCVATNFGNVTTNTKKKFFSLHIAWKASVFSIFPHSLWMRRYTPCLSVFSPNAGKYGPEKLRIRTIFKQCHGFCGDISNIKSVVIEYIKVFSFEKNTSNISISSWVLKQNCKYEIIENI